MSTASDKEKVGDQIVVESARKELEGFAPSTKTSRSPTKGPLKLTAPPAPRKPATRATAPAEDDEEGPSSPTPTRPSPSIQVPTTPTKAPSPVIQVPATPESETTIQETQGTTIDSFQATLQAIIQTIGRSRDKLANPKTTLKVIKDEVTIELTNIIAIMTGLNSMSDNMASIKREIREVKEAILETAKAPLPTPTNWATVAATPRIQTQTQTHRLRYRDQEIDEENQKKQAERRLERAKVEITLTTEGAPQATRSKLNSISYEQITAALQKVVDESTPPTETPIKIGGFRILKSTDIRFTCETAEEAVRLRHINWTEAFEGLIVRQPRFGIVIHGISTDEINPRSDDLDNIASEISEQNGITVVQLRTLRALAKLDPMARHNSFVLLTHDKNAADNRLKKGIILNCRLYPVEKYTPQYQLTQCFNCQ
jgi:hypothetical protein